MFSLEESRGGGGRWRSFIGGRACVNRGGSAHVMLCRREMGDPRALEAIRRIEQALARIEAAASRPMPASSPHPSEEFERLKEAHDALRRRVSGAIGQIDRLLETGEAR
jgi:hypothetical protein